jgi:hypothetical protein
MKETAAACRLIWAGLVIASGMLLINDAGVVAEIYVEDPAHKHPRTWLLRHLVNKCKGRVGPIT